jgi:N-acetyl sugar amidotransferase
LPTTKPDLKFSEDGECNACETHRNKDAVDWERRRIELIDILEKYKNPDSWDCIVPVSGGKDSTYQILKILELGYRPLAVTSTTCDLSEIGRQNLENISKLGVDHIVLSPNRKVRATLNRFGLENVGDISWPEHVGIFTIPVRVAVQYKVPLIIWGENSQNEYGGPARAIESSVLDRRWLEEFGGLLGMRVQDVQAITGLSQQELIPYQYPLDSDLEEVGVTGLFLGHYIKWDGLSNYLVANANGFRTSQAPVEGSMVNYENLDNHQTGIHDYFKFLKYGFGRTSDIASLHIRRGRISRDEALQIVIQNDGKFPWTCLGKPLEEILEPLEITVQQFVEICDKFTNKRLFLTNTDGTLKKDRNGNLTKINYDNV